MPLGPVSSTWSRGHRAPVHGFKVSFPSGFRGPQDIFLHKGPMPWAEGQQGSPRSRAPCSACLVEHERQAQVFLVVPLAEGPSLLPRGSMCQSLRTRPGKGGRTDRHALQPCGKWGSARARHGFVWQVGGLPLRLLGAHGKAVLATTRPPLKTTVCPAAALAQEGWASGQCPWGRRR